MCNDALESEIEKNESILDKDKPAMTPPNQKKLSLWKWWGIHDSKFVSIGTILAAVATSLMAYFTYSSIEEARKMREETKKLVDLSMQDFKIRAYPSFLVSTPSLVWKENDFIGTTTIYNKGEITAHNVTMLLVKRFVDSENKVLFVNEMGTFYKGDEAKTTLNFETKIFREGYKTIEYKSKIDRNDQRGRLTHQLIYIRFKIPFEDKHDYEVFAFILKRDDQKKESDENAYVWQETDVELRDKLISGHLKSLRNSKDDMANKIKAFLSDYPELISGG